jgi:hypothetical protein
MQHEGKDKTETSTLEMAERCNYGVMVETDTCPKDGRIE